MTQQLCIHHGHHPAGPCPECERARGSAHARGYTRAWQRMRALAIQAHPYCTDCGHPGSPDNPLTGDHITPLTKGGLNTPANIAVRCRTCNSTKGRGHPTSRTEGTRRPLASSPENKPRERLGSNDVPLVA